MNEVKINSKEAKQKKMVLLAISIASFIGPFEGSMTNLALPLISDTFQISASMLGWVSTSYLLTTAALLVPAARISDVFGRKRIFITGMIGLGLTAVVTPLSPNFYFFLFCRMLAGFSAACVMSTAVPIISDIFIGKDRGLAFGTNTAFVYLGISLGPVLGGFLVSYLGWESLFYILLIPISIATYILFVYMKNEIYAGTDSAFDKTGTVFYAVSLTLFLFGLTKIPSLEGILITVIGFIMLVGFVQFERKQEYPVFDVNLFFENRIFSRSNFAAVFNYASTFAIAFFLSLYLQKVGLIPAKTAGLILLTQPLVQAILSPPAGKLSSVISGKYLSTLGMIIIAGGLIFLSGLQKELNIYYLVTAQITLGLGFALFSSPNTNTIMSSVSRKDQGSAGGIMATMRQIGMVFSMAIAMSSITFFIGSTDQLGPDTIDSFLLSMKTTFHICSVLCLIGAGLSWSRGNSNDRKKQQKIKRFN